MNKVTLAFSSVFLFSSVASFASEYMMRIPVSSNAGDTNKVEYTEWANSGGLSGCTDWAPDEDQVGWGTVFLQSRDCTQKQTREVNYKVCNDFSSNCESEKIVTEEKELPVKETESMLGKLRDNTSCKTLNAQDKSLPSGNYNLKLGSFYCDMETDGGGWTVIQSRTSSSDFYQGWSSYANGFGSGTNYWKGLNNIHELTKNGAQAYFKLKDFSGNERYAKYNSFSVGNASSRYLLSVSGYSGNAGDSFSGHNGLRFSTPDWDNDTYSGSCALSYKGAWWYGACHSSNLNGRYLGGEHGSYADGMNWYTWRGHHYSLKETKIMIR